METPIAEIQHWDTWNSKYRQMETMDEPCRRRMREILGALKNLKVHNAKILEVGCGTGWLSSMLLEFGDVTAVDLGVEIIQTAKAHHPEIDFRSGDIHTLDLPTNFFDVVITLETFSHVPDQATFVRRLSQLLKPGGLLLLTTQNKSVFDRCANIPPNVGYLRKWVNIKTLKHLLQPAFSIRRSTSLEPEGHLGLLRIVNSSKVNKCLGAALGASRVKRLKESAGFGQTLFVMAAKR